MMDKWDENAIRIMRENRGSFLKQPFKGQNPGF